MVIIIFLLKHQNFEEQMQGMKTQLIQLSTLLRLLDSGFCSYLGKLGEYKYIQQVVG